ncbi:hypothetical protein Tco_0288904, partial [Tanacetum coccineum]
GKLFDSCTSKVDSEPPDGSNVDIPNIHDCKQTLDSMATEKADISETIVKVDSQMMIQKNDVCSQQFRPQTSMSNDASFLKDKRRQITSVLTPVRNVRQRHLNKTV